MLRVSPVPRRMGTLKGAGRGGRREKAAYADLHLAFRPAWLDVSQGRDWAWELRKAPAFRCNWFRHNWHKLMKISHPLDFFSAKWQLTYFVIVLLLPF